MYYLIALIARAWGAVSQELWPSDQVYMSHATSHLSGQIHFSRDQTCIYCVSCIAGLYHHTTWEAQIFAMKHNIASRHCSSHYDSNTVLVTQV